MRLFLEPGFSNKTLWEAGVPSGSPHCGLVMGFEKFCLTSSNIEVRGLNPSGAFTKSILIIIMN